ncbi:helix-turn-helix domain-containing protein [Mesorhizobium sp. Cs1299R1N3]|uniref:helix-turn-helix domain-containing protein n=1 Tax=Mesorhizobium sp. Cs1299R1N3 TaxID=3015173 RepID=UPI00301BED05
MTNSTASQNDLVLEHLEVLGTITPLEALKEYGCLRLGARIHDLKAKGHMIGTDLIPVGDDGKRVAQYSLIRAAA